MRALRSLLAPHPRALHSQGAMAVPIVRKVYDGFVKHLITWYLGGKLNPSAIKLAFLVMLLQIKSTVMSLWFGGQSGDSRMASSALETGAKLAKRTADAGVAASVEDVIGDLGDDDEFLGSANEMATDLMVWRSANATREEEENRRTPPASASAGSKPPTFSSSQSAAKLNEVQRELADVRSRLTSVAATTIQKIWRGAVVRRSARGRAQSRPAASARRTTRVASVAAMTIQQHWRGTTPPRPSLHSPAAAQTEALRIPDALPLPSAATSSPRLALRSFATRAKIVEAKSPPLPPDDHEELAVEQSGCTCSEAETTTGQATDEEYAPISPVRLLRF